MSIDRYSHRSLQIADALRGDTQAAHELHVDLRDGLHQTTLTVPILVAVLSLALGSIPASFAVTSLLMLALMAALASRLAKMAWLGPGETTGAIAAILFLGHCLTIRTSA